MANNYSSGTFTPEIPTHLMTDRLYELIEACNIQTDKDECNKSTYLYSEDGIGSGGIDTEEGIKEINEDDVFAELQSIIKTSNGELLWVTYECAYTCDKMRQGEFGGAAVFITADDIEYCSTSNWLQQMKEGSHKL